VQALAKLDIPPLALGSSAAAKVGASGKAKVRIRFSPKAARLLHGRKAARVTISVRFKPAGGTATVTRIARLTVKR